MLGNGLHVLGNGPHLCTQFMNRAILNMRSLTGLLFVYLGPIGLGNETHVLD